MNREQWIELSKEYSERDKELLLRAYDILISNIYEKDAGYLWSPYRCISPARRFFLGIWNWDSAFHSIGMSRIDNEIAKEGILGFLKFQRADGLLPDVIWERGEIEDSYSKPPVFPWAAEIVYKKDKDINFLKEIYPKFVLNENYIVKNRSYEGLFYYDADNKEKDDYITRVKWESGWDNSVRWDNGITNYWAIDLNCFMVLFYRAMSYFAQELNLIEDYNLWSEKEKVLTKKINELLWDDKNQWYADADRFTKEVSPSLTPASFMPLFIGIATKEQGEKMAYIAKTKFKCKMPTVSFDNPEYSNDYWRGPTWINTAYFAAKGLKIYGYNDVADAIKNSVLDMCFYDKGGLFQNYNSITGEGQYRKCNNFSWSSVFVIEFILNF